MKLLFQIDVCQWLNIPEALKNTKKKKRKRKTKQNTQDRKCDADDCEYKISYLHFNGI